jgi:single-strand DNA-binding protein
MRKSLNQVQLIGNLGKDPTMRYTPSGKAVTNFSLATNHSWKDASGEWQNETEWHNITVWGNLAELANNQLKKGMKVFVQGRLKTEHWTGEDGTERTKVVVVADNIVQVDGGGSSSGDAADDDDSLDHDSFEFPF